MKLLPVGQAVAMHVHGPTARVAIPAQVQESSRLDECVLSLPTLLYPTSRMIHGAEVTLRFTNPNGIHQVVAVIMDFSRNLPIEVTLGDFQAALTIQRRNYSRAAIDLPMVAAVIASKAEKVGAQDKRAVMIDIGGGGVRFDSVLAPVVDDRMGIWVEVPARLQKWLPAVLQSEGKVVRVEQVIRGDTDMQRLAVEFRVRRDVERDPWVRLAMDIQRGAHLDHEDPDET